MTLAPLGVRRNPCTKHTDRSRSQRTLRTLPQIRQYNPRRSQKLLQGLGATPVGSLARPHGNSTLKCSLHSSASARMKTQGLLSRISVRGTLTDMHIENIRMQVEASNSMPCLVIRTILDDCGLKHGKSVLRIDRGSSVGCRRIRK